MLRAPQAEQRALAGIQTRLLQNGRTCADLGFPDIQDVTDCQTTEDPVTSNEDQSLKMLMLNEDQNQCTMPSCTSFKVWGCFLFTQLIPKRFWYKGGAFYMVIKSALGS